MAALEIEVSGEPACISARLKMVVERMMRATEDRHCFHITAYAPIDKMCAAVDLAPIEAEESMTLDICALFIHLPRFPVPIWWLLHRYIVYSA